MDRSLTNQIDMTLEEIGGGYKPGLLMWLRSHPNGWARLLDIEGDINRAALAGDEVGLKVALGEYRGFFKEMSRLYERGVKMPLFEEKRA